MMNYITTYFAPVLLFAAFILLLLVSLSVPIIKSIYLFSFITSVEDSSLDSSTSGSVTFGVWGYCASASDSILGSKNTAIAQCSKIHLGYTFDQTVAQALDAQGIKNLVSRATTGALVLHPVSCVLTFLTLLLVFYMIRRGYSTASRSASLLTLGVGLLTAFFATLATLIDVILVGVVRPKIHDDTQGHVTMDWGNAIWLTLTATGMLWLYLGTSAGQYVFGRRSKY